jgi:hypothetical protein
MLPAMSRHLTNINARKDLHAASSSFADFCNTICHYRTNAPQQTKAHESGYSTTLQNPDRSPVSMSATAFNGTGRSGKRKASGCAHP